MQERPTQQGRGGLTARSGERRDDEFLTSGRSLTIRMAGILTLLIASMGLPAGVHAAGIEPHEAIIDAAVKHIRQLPDARRLKGLTVTARPLDSRLRLAACDVPLETFDPYRSPVREKMTVGVACAGKSPWKIFVPVTISAQTPVVVLKRALPRGSRLAASDVAVETRKIFPGIQPLLSHASDAIGQTLTRGMPAGVALTTGMVKPPRLVSRGDKITLVVSYNSLEVRSQGEALQDGIVGQRIAATTDSRRTVEGWVQTDGTLRVSR